MNRMLSGLVVVLIVSGSLATTGAQSQSQTQSQSAKPPPDARELVKQAEDTFQKLKSYRFEAVRTTETSKENMGSRSDEKSNEMFSLIGVNPDRFRGELKSPPFSLTFISDGKTEWVISPELKQYSRKPKMDEKALMTTLAGGGEMFSAVLANMGLLMARSIPAKLSEYHALAKGIKKAQVVRKETITVNGKSIDCDVVEVEYVPVRGAAGDELSSRTLWIDGTRNLVLRDVKRSKSPMPFGGSMSSIVDTRFNLAEINIPVADSFFTFVASPDLTEVERIEVRSSPSPLVGSESVDFTLKDVEGREINLRGLRGKVVLLDFWATWCAPCLIELPYIEKLHREFKDQGLVVLGMNAEDANVARDFMKEKAYTFTTLVDQDRVVAERYNVEAIPQVLIVGRDGKVASHFVGLKGEKDLRDALAKLGLRSDPTRAATSQAGESPTSPRPPSVVLTPSAPRDTAITGQVTFMVTAPKDVNLSATEQNSFAARAVKSVQPVYPPIAKAAKASGPVHVLVLVSAEGTVIDSSVISGHPLLRDAALTAAKQWTFKPQVENGASVRSLAVVTFYFSPLN